MVDAALAFIAEQIVGVSYDFRDDFTTEEAAPLASPRTAEPGPGTLTLVQNDGSFEINSSSQLVPNKQTTIAWNDLGLISVGSVARTAGRILVGTLRANNNGHVADFGWSDSATMGYDGRRLGYTWTSGGTWMNFPGTKIADYGASTMQVACTLRATGGFLLANVDSGGWKLLWVDGASTATPLYVYFQTRSLTEWDYVDDFRIPDSDTTYTPTPLASDSFNRGDSSDLGSTDGAGAEESGGDGLAWTEQAGDLEIKTNRLQHKTAGVANCTVDPSVSDVLLQAVINWVAGTNGGIMFRYTGSDDFWLWAAAETANQVIMYENNAGSFTIRGTASVTINASQDYDLLLVADGNSVTGYFAGGNRVNYASATFQQTATVHGLYTNLAGDRFDNFVVWPRTVTDFPEV